MSAFAVVNLRDGTRRDMVPFLLDNDAFPILRNAYLFRGRIEKRSGFSYVGNGRLVWQIGTTSSSPFTYTLPDAPITAGYPQFSIGSVVFTDPGGSSPVTLLSSDPSYSGTLNRTTGALSISTPMISDTPVYYFPGLPVMALETQEQTPVNDEGLIGFDTRYSYYFNVGTEMFVAANFYKTTGSIFTWSGVDYQKFWGINYYQAFWATNNVPGVNGYTVTSGTNAMNCTFSAPTGHNITVGDFLQIMYTTTSTTNFAGFTFEVTNVSGTTITINNAVAPGAAWAGVVIQLNRQTLDITGSFLGDAIKWYDGPGGGDGWVNFIPPLSAQVGTNPPNYLQGSLIILPYKGSLIALNTWESAGNGGVVNYPQRARWNAPTQTPFYTTNNNTTVTSRPSYLTPGNASAVQNSWFTTSGLGGYVDAPTSEAIVGAEFIKDTLIVYFERSTWQLVYTDNTVTPFVFQKINTELGTESTFSTVPFDRGVFGVGNYGIITCDSVNVSRIDQKIPDEVFSIQNINQGPQRISGIRDYNAQLVYWAYPIRDEDGSVDMSYAFIYPNNVLVYNYLDGSWATFEDSLTAFGYWQRVQDVTWEELDLDPQNSWQNTNFSWNSQLNVAKYPSVIAGNQRGFVFVYSQQQNLGLNVPSLEISNFSGATITCPNHNLTNGQFVLVENCTGFTASNGQVFIVTQVAQNTFVLQPQSPLLPPDASGYTGGGTLVVIPNINITTKQYNPFYQEGQGVRLKYMDVYTNVAENGAFSATFFTDSQTSVALDTQEIDIGPSPLIPYQLNQAQVFNRCYTEIAGAFFQVVYSYTNDQMFNLDNSGCDVVIQGILYYVSPAGRLSYDYF